MKIKKELHNKWLKLREKGDEGKIIFMNPEVSKNAVYQCVKYGEYIKLSVFEAVAKYYEYKEREFNKLQNKYI